MKKKSKIQSIIVLQHTLPLSLLIFIIFFFPLKILAYTDMPLPTMTVINLIRGNGLGHENDDLASSLKAQWQVTKEMQINATWLLQYSTLEDQRIVDIAKNEMVGQEFGLLFEIDRNFSQKTNIVYKGQGAWFFSDGLFLLSYDVHERRKLIDKAFSKFKQIFGYYPKTVGAWWIGGDSLLYMQKKYGITAALRAADQFNLDFYSFWGTPWSIPYIASKTNEAIPAESFEDSSKVVILQWAVRDPFEGYADPLFSIQDYSIKGYGNDYFNYLTGIFLTKSFHNMVIGFENGGTLENFNQTYRTMLLQAKELEEKKKISILLAKDFSRQFLDQKKIFPYPSYFLSYDYDSQNQSFWYISENYRAMIQKNDDSIYLADLRDYSNKIEEDFSVLPNTQSRLRITTPEIIDSIRFPDSKILLKKTTEPMEIEENNNEVTLYAGKDSISRFTPIQMNVLPGDDKNGKIYNFKGKHQIATLIVILYGVVFIYFLFILFKKKNILLAVKSFFPLVIPLLLASSFLTHQSVFLFDTKEGVLLIGLFSLGIFSVLETLIIAKFLPFIILILLHFFSNILYPTRRTKILYYIFFFLTCILYLHFPYFPLDKSTVVSVVLSFAFLTVILLSFIVYSCTKIRVLRKKLFLIALVPMILGLLLFTTVFSRSTLALTSYEISALQVIKNSKKPVIYVEQFENSIRPIYKAVKPLLYNYFQIAPIITGTYWNIVTRPSYHIVQLTDYDNKLIVIPKYLGSDISDYEIQTLGLKKIFDNAQILIFEKK